MLTNKIGIVIIEALHMLKEPALLKDIVEKVALLLKLTVADVHESVAKSLEGGLKYGYLLKKRSKYAFKINLTSVKESNRNFKNEQHKKTKNEKTVLTKDRKVDLVQSNTEALKTIFKCEKQMRPSSDLSLKSSGFIHTTRRNKPSVEFSIKSVPMTNVKSNLAHMPRKINKNMNVIFEKLYQEQKRNFIL